jgi:hypothetical protein
VGQHKTRESSADRCTVEQAHTGMIERLAVLKSYRILYIADAQDLKERAEHLQQILGAVLDYVGAIVADTDHVAPDGSIDRKYLLGLISDVAGDVAMEFPAVTLLAIVERTAPFIWFSASSNCGSSLQCPGRGSPTWLW